MRPTQIVKDNLFSLKINHKQITEKHTDMRLNNMLLNNEWVNNEMKKKIKTYLETNENDNRATHHLWDTG